MTQHSTPEPIFLADNTRFKLCFNKAGNATNFHGWQDILEGRWVALVPAEDDAHMSLYALRRQSLKLADVTRQLNELKPSSDEVEIRSRLYQRVHELEALLMDIADYTGEGPATTDWQGIVKLIADSARDALRSDATSSATPQTTD